MVFPKPAPTDYNLGTLFMGLNMMSALYAKGIRVDGFQWRYSPEIPRPTSRYEPHYDLRGTFHDNLPTDEGLYPKDHRGCLCAAVPVLRGPDGRFTKRQQLVG